METSTRSVGTTLWRGLTALHAGIQIVAAMFSLHSTGNACNVCVQPTQKWRAIRAYLSAMNQERSLE